MKRVAGVVGLGLIGGSIGMGLREQGWRVLGSDSSPEHEHEALDLGAIDEVSDPAVADVCFIATPVGRVAEIAAELLDRGARVVTDVGSVKGAIASQIDDPRFVPGHPMAGSEQEGVRGARADLFHGAVWVLSPAAHTSDASLATVRAVVSELGADIVTLDPVAHDRLVAMVSHVPHLTAATLMRLASDRAVEHRALLRLAAGGFRDMTRIAAGHPGIWPDICAENSTAITEVLDALIDELGAVRTMVSAADRDGLFAALEAARVARTNLPTGVPKDIALSVLRVPVLDRPGELASITRLATDVDVNIYDVEIAHSPEGSQGVVILVVPTTTGERLVGALMAHGYRPSIRPLEGE